MISDAEKRFDELDALYVKLRGLREVRRDLVEQTSRLDIEIGEVRLRLTQKHDAFQRLDDASIQSAASPVPGADTDPRPRPVPAAGGGSFTLRALTPRGEQTLPELQRLLAPLLGDSH